MTITADQATPGTQDSPTHNPTEVGTEGPFAATPDEAAFLDRLTAIRDEITLPEQFTLIIDRDHQHPQGRFYYQIEATRIDTFTGKLGTGRGSKAYLTPHATRSELVQTVFGLYDAYCHHEVRETFLWRGRRVFGPHIDIEAHWQIAETYDARPTA